MKTAVYPGSFDPVTHGHLDIITRASRVFDQLIVTVMYNRNKTPFFAPEERVALIRQAVKALPNVRVEMHEGLLIDYLKNKDDHVLIKGLRTVSDFESESQMAIINHDLLESVETVFMTTKPALMHISSSVVKEVASFGGDISGFVTEEVREAMNRKMGGKNGESSK